MDIRIRQQGGAVYFTAEASVIYVEPEVDIDWIEAFKDTLTISTRDKNPVRLGPDYITIGENPSG